MTEHMSRPTRKEAERLKEQGVFDVGITYIQVGWGRPPKHRFWDGYVPRDEREGKDQL